MEIYFVTGNKHKFEEAALMLHEFGIIVHMLNVEKIEPKEFTLEQVALSNAQNIANKLNKIVMVDDTGVFFEAYDNFPGSNPKLCFSILGYKGLLKTVAGEKRDAYFKSVVALCIPGQEPILFTGKLECVIANDVEDLEKDVMPYERILIGKNINKRLSKLTREEKNEISHRGKAFKQLGQYLKENSSVMLKR